MSHDGQPTLLAEVIRNGFAESRHYGVVSVMHGGVEIASAGLTSDAIFPRSALKPLQLIAMLDAGLGSIDWSHEQLAVMASSHSGQPEHIAAVRSILMKAGLVESQLQNTPGWPMDPAARHSLREQGITEKAAIFADCSGKHAAMLATCLINDWSLQNYRAADHPLQQRIAQVVSEFTRDSSDFVGVDGCGAPLFSCTTTGLARSYAALLDAAQGSPAARVAQAMRANPSMVAGKGRDVTAAMVHVPGLIVKDGAEGVFAAALIRPGDTAATGIAIKIADGASRPRATVLAQILSDLGVGDPAPEWARHAVLGGGRVVGQIQPALSLVWKP